MRGGTHMICPNCQSPKTVKNGKKYNGKQNYKCNACKKQFIERTAMYRMRHSIKEILFALLLKFQRQSLREIAKLWFLEFLRKTISHVTAYNWCMKFKGKFEELMNTFPIDFTNIWHVDEKFVKVRGSKDRHAYLWKVIDSNNNIVAVHVSNRRDIFNAKKVLKKALKLAKKPPDILVSDGLQAYKRAKGILGRKCKHVIAHFKGKFVMKNKVLYYLSNNRIERSNSTTNLFLLGFRGFKSFKTANSWCTMYQAFFNYLRATYSLAYKRQAEAYGRYEYKGWKQLVIC